MANEKTGEQISADNATAMASLSSEDVFNDLFNVSNNKSEVSEEKVDLQLEKELDQLNSPIDVETEIPSNVEEKNIEEDKKDENSSEETEEKPEFKLPEEIEEEKKSDSDSSIKEEAESTWKDLAKPFGLELQEDSYDAYVEGINKTIETKVIEAKELAKVDAEKAILESLAKTPEAKMLLDFLNNKGTLDEYIKPTADIEKLQALSDSELVAKDLELRGWDAEKIDEYIEDRIERGKLSLDAYEIRKILDTNKENIAAERAIAQKEYMQKEELRIKEAIAKDTTQIYESIDKRKEFMDTVIGEKQKEYVKKKWANGEYSSLLKDPDFIAEALFQREFGKQGVENLKSKSFQNGKETIAKKLHNIPPKSNVGGKRIETQVKSPIGNVEALSDLTDYK